MNMEHRLELKMAEDEPSQVSSIKNIRQSISVPFVWEVIPGTPKKDWKPTPPPAKPMAPPVKLIASVPFGWEEKPGKPLPYCSQPPPSSPLALPRGESNSFQSPVKIIASVPSKWEEKLGKPLPCFSQPPSHAPLALPQAECNSFPSLPGNSEGKGDNWIYMNDHETEILESDPETCEYETDDGSFSSTRSFSANSSKPTLAISYAIPSQQSPPKDLKSGQLQSPGSPASEIQSSSSYATGTTSLVGAAFLEWLFPLLTPHSSFLDKVGCSESVSRIQSKKQSTNLDQQRNYSATIRRPPTLGELIMMSRRRSYQRKAIQLQKQNLSEEMLKRNPLGCCIFGTSNILGRLDMKWKRQLQLKLI